MPTSPSTSHNSQLTELRIDFAAPRGQETKITAVGFAEIRKLPLIKLGMENAESIPPGAIAELGEIKTLRQIHIFPARGTPTVHNESVAKYQALLAPLRDQLADLEITFQEPFVRK